MRKLRTGLKISYGVSAFKPMKYLATAIFAATAMVFAALVCNGQDARCPSAAACNGQDARCPSAAACNGQDARCPSTLDLEIKVTNLWPNRLIGDDRLYANDCEWVKLPRPKMNEYFIKEIPQWVKDGKPSPTGRCTFTTWRPWTKDDALLPSGLIGPVVLRFGETVDLSCGQQVHVNKDEM